MLRETWVKADERDSKRRVRTGVGERRESEGSGDGEHVLEGKGGRENLIVFLITNLHG